jgi:hypothetical protein
MKVHGAVAKATGRSSPTVFDPWVPHPHLRAQGSRLGYFSLKKRLVAYTTYGPHIENMYYKLTHKNAYLTSPFPEWNATCTK